ncbi:dinuclear metal center YbgI/SA1388 family protein [Natranaerovirga pectinivora]|uniref:GTP cyclohydrolase 1 type 2 homolog n=1 Tax=Natranaerovirga pectinivora TaxID=682400 RepID=A0A4R3MPU2_9FIRM|nr:Nif3-like dinuclear metal center hexameric protein [Natranaerovirga pectinivora]TCT15639.1 dinuclear metal center YbgI/SA1388 family protein [Natranaerovirga pectinivora]
MRLTEIEEFIVNLFDSKYNEFFHKESGITVRGKEDVRKIGYCTNLTLDTIEEARKNNVDLIITHHDAWDFIFGLKDACHNKLMEYNMSHYFNHLPLDDCHFGTNDSLIEKLGLHIIERTHIENGFYCGRIAEFKEEIEFEELVKRIEVILEEPVKAWKFKVGKVKRIGLVCGGGGLTSDVREAFEKNCDVYITGEKTLYTIEYAKFVEISLIIGSHTFTELFGIESLARQIADKYKDIEIIRLVEEHLEV